MKLEVRPSALLFLALMTLSSRAVVGWKQALWAGPAIVLSALAHELGHVVAARAFGVLVKRVGLSIKGAYNVRHYASSRKAEAVITCAGPAANLALAALMVVTVPFLPTRAGIAGLWVASANLVLALANLLPVGPSDGRRLWHLASSSLASRSPESRSPELDKAA